MATGVVKTFEGSYNRYVSNWGSMTLKMKLTMTQTYNLGTGKSSLRFSNFQMGYFCPNNIGNFASYINGTIKVTVNGTTYTIFQDSDGAGSAPSYRANFYLDTFDTVKFSSGTNNGSDWFFDIADLTHASDGSLSVSVEWTGLTAFTNMQGNGLTISGSETVSLTANPVSYALAINAGTGSSITVNRTSSPNAGAATGKLSNGAAIFHGDVLEITFGASTGYNLGTHTVNGSTFTSGGSCTVSAAVKVVSSGTVKSFALSVQKNAKATAGVKRTSSPLQGAGTGTLANGDTIFYNDVLLVEFSAPSGYKGSATLNGAAIANGSEHTVTGSVTVVVSVKAQGFISVGQGGSFRQYQPKIGDGTEFDIYIPKISK